MKIKVNGHEIEIKDNSTIADFVKERNIEGIFAIEKNLEIINKDRYETEILKEGDNIELVGFTGGG
ncbi:TPA: sulfur carrier protein ThiS [Candidatus Galligastranaerophilus gallistercoris]|nr:sulfur carrier protein ThiS [Candidatus Galligastranaerophilus gallistercoris]